MIRIRTASRLHFGLLDVLGVQDHSVAEWRSASGLQGVGSVGLMVEHPGLTVVVRPALTWSADGPLAHRACELAKRFAKNMKAIAAHHITVEDAAPEHVGLGTGTQLSLAVARGLALCSDLEELDCLELARQMGRGVRSAIGIHGFQQGGLLVDGGSKTDRPARLVARRDFPGEWRMVVVIPHCRQGLHGEGEKQAFEALRTSGTAPAQLENICSLVWREMLPAVSDQDLLAFGESLYSLNRQVGEIFQAVQRGLYGGAEQEALIAFIRKQGVQGVGQSSWGPAIFALTGDEHRALDLAARLRRHFAFSADEVLVTGARNRGASINKMQGPPDASGGLCRLND
jgi:beta-RFAP synthase